jgi:hypothetical protein
VTVARARYRFAFDDSFAPERSAIRHFLEASRAALASRRHFRYHLALILAAGKGA